MVETKGTGTILVLIVVVVAVAAAKAIRTMKRIIIIVKRVEENPRAAASTKSFVYTARKSNLSVKRPVSRFQSQARGVLLCTDVGARGLDFDNVGATVQVDPPTDSKTYAHRVGRAARLGNDGEAVLFLGPKELEFEDALKNDIEDLTFSKAKLKSLARTKKG